jgi:hypothetical protein
MMLTSELGIRLVLWLGKTVPLPAPVEVLTSLSRVEVTQDADGEDGFSMTFSLSKDRSLEFSLLRVGALEPFSRVIIGVALGLLPEALIDGIITHHQVQPSSEPGQSSLTVMGRSVSVMLDLKEENEQHKNLPDSEIVRFILLKYAQYGIVPAQVMLTPDIPIELQRVVQQQDTDLRFIQELARRNGFVFYLEPLTFGVNNAYFGPENRVGLPQPALTMDMGAATNVNSLSFSNDALSPVGTEGRFVEPFFKTVLPIPPLPSLRIPPLAANPAPAKRTQQLRRSAQQNPAQAAQTAVAAVTNTPEAVRAEGDVDTMRYGSVLRARRLVGVRGAGLSYDGFYYLRRVTHSIEKSSQSAKYSQRFSLSREGTGALLPVVRP